MSDGDAGGGARQDRQGRRGKYVATAGTLLGALKKLETDTLG
jgi:hypothetical protein